jgi:hypothetical protein
VCSTQKHMFGRDKHLSFVNNRSTIDRFLGTHEHGVHAHAHTHQMASVRWRYEREEC